MEDYIFYFNDRSALQIQDNAICQELWLDFWKRVGLKFPDTLSFFDKSCSRIEWQARYASAVVFRRLDSLNTTIWIVGLDKWESVIHSSTHGRESIAVPDVTAPAVFCLGRMETSCIDELVSLLSQELQKSELNNTGNRRGQSVGHRGNQKTPSFLRAVLLDVLRTTEGGQSTVSELHQNVCGNTSIQGGTTDVGMHTGCIPRNTSFPLVEAVVHWWLRTTGEPDDQKFLKCRATHLLSYLGEVSDNVTEFSPRAVDRVITVARVIRKISTNIRDQEFFDTLVLNVKTRYNNLLSLRSEPSGEAVSFDDGERIWKSLRPPKMPAEPKWNPTTDPKEKMDRARADSMINLRMECLSFASYDYTGHVENAYLQIARLNAYFWKAATELDDKNARYDVSKLRTHLSCFSKHVKLAQQNSMETPHLMTVRFRSEEMLAIWISFCWAFRTAEERHVIFRAYGSALDPSDLQYIALPESRGAGALECVRAFLDKKMGRSRFCRPFKSVKDTLTFALQFGRRSHPLRAIHDNELSRANELIEDRWKKVRETQQTLRQLDGELATAQQELHFAEQRFRHSQSSDYNYCSRTGAKRYSSVYYENEQKRNACQGKVSSLESHIAALERKPNDLYLGLPRDPNKSLQWLFFLFMPDEFRNLAALAQLGQSMLWERSPSSNSMSVRLLSWFRSHRKMNRDNPKDAEIVLGSKSDLPKITTPGIRNYVKESGVLFPDVFSVDPYWESYDPFSPEFGRDEATLLYTEQLSSNVDGCSYMQTFLAMLPSKTRENESIAFKERKPSWLNPEQYVAFSNLRSHPRTQIRCFVEALHDNLLPFHDYCVHILVKQLLYHIGDVGWKIDLTAGWLGYERLATELRRQLDTIRDSPKDCDSLLLFGVACSFLGQTNVACMDLALEYSATSRKWADEISKEFADTDQISPPDYWKRAKLYCYALLCLSFGELSDTWYGEVTELLVLFRKNALLASDVEESRSMNTVVNAVMAWRIEPLLEFIHKNTDHLTTCMSLLFDFVPDTLHWSPVLSNSSTGTKTACFEARDSKLFSVNLFDGTVLVNGVPPSVLPAVVLSNNLYQRTFGNRNFVVVPGSGIRQYTAANLVDKRYRYEFVFDLENSLLIRECDEKSGDTLLLVPRENLDLPVLLREQHSHWYSRRHDMVFLRGKLYRCRNTKYAMTDGATFSIPTHFEKSEAFVLTEQLDTFDRLCLGDTSLCEFLRGFEFETFVQIFFDHSWSIRLHLPRYKLSFLLLADGTLSCTEFKGFRLDDRTVLVDTLPQLNGYIPLKHTDGRKKILVPGGVVDSDALVQIPQDWNAPRHYFTYDIHRRFRHLTTGTSLGRLHLASLYASSACNLPEKRCGKTGFSIASDLVRFSWRNEPFSSAERLKIVEISSHSRLSCTLSMLCSWVWQCSNSVAFLYGEQRPRTAALELDPRTAALELDPLAVDEYVRNEYAPRLNPSEELTLLGSRRTVLPTSSLVGTTNSNELDFVQRTEEAMLEDLVVERRKSRGTQQRFPLDRPKHCHGLDRKVFDDIEESHRLYYRLKEQSYDPGFKDKVSELFQTVRKRRKTVEESILETLSRDVFADSQNRLSVCCGKYNVASPLDLLRVICDDAPVLERVAPQMTASSRKDTRMKCLGWGALCILEDRLQRLSSGDLSQDHQALISEITCIRRWSPTKHPRWIAFEVEQGLQIRPDQYTIVQQLLNQNGSIIQLNMGLGKTRVLVPMLVLEYMATDDISRINVLSSIIGEFVEYFRNALVATVQNVKLFTLPVNRDIKFGETTALRLYDELEKCSVLNGSLVVTPQHRLSLLLKQHEQGVFVDLRKLRGHFVDILDESDAILSHEFQLVYAIGAQENLPDGPSRWKMVQAFLLLLCRCDNNDLTGLIYDEETVHTEQTHNGSFSNMRLLLPFKGKEQALASILCRALVLDPPYDLRWMKGVEKRHIDELISIMSDPTYKNSLASIEKNELFCRNRSDILAARGIVAYGTLVHGLGKRYRVNYGLKPSSTIKLAVPYFASDTPKPKTQYSHPDMCIIYTALSYLHEGLNRQQLRESLLYLQTELGPEAQKKVYGEFIEAIRDDVTLDVLSRFDDPNKVDVNNGAQFEIIYSCLKKCMEVIFFWTSIFVFPSETKQFPKKRATNAWNVCEESTIGFSGTDDNRYLLPLSVHQVSPNEDHLRATNGEMINLILRCTKEIHMLQDDSQTPLWKSVADNSVALNVRALIDVSGLMAGSKNCKVAVYLSEMLDRQEFKGVVYFDQDQDAWYLYESGNSQGVPLKSSSFTETECFVFFDESRCRGSDMKLPLDACALVTVEPKLTKDKFLQGCARMRKLRSGQSLILAGTSEALEQRSTAKDVLETILHRTATVLSEGVPTFFHRGMDYFRFPEPIIDDISLQGMYSDRRPVFYDFADYLESQVEVDLEEQSDGETELIEHCKALGDRAVDAGKLSEECEQELEHEAECENEQEQEVAHQEPFRQIDWNFSKAFSDPDSLFDGCFISLTEFIEKKLRRIKGIDWGHRVFCSPNFWKTIEASERIGDLSAYVRPVNAFLTTGDGRLVLLSTYDTDKLLPLWWSTRNPRATLRHLCLAEDNRGFGRDDRKAPEVATTLSKLFRGYVNYSPSQQRILRAAFSDTKDARAVVQEILHIRFRLGYFDRSDLELVSTLAPENP